MAENNHTSKIETHNPKDLPTYNLKAVVQETGLKQDTLRAWERRYGVPQPERTAGGHRLYSERDIEVLKWLVARQQEGLSISRAVDLWHRLVEEGRDPLREAPTSPPPTIQSIQANGGTIEKLRDAWIEACMTFDEKTAEQLLTQAAALYPPEVVCTEFLQKALAEVGQKWINGEITVQQEHFASTLAVRRMEALIASAPGPTRPGRILVGCPPEELHVFSLLMVTFMLRRNGWDTMFLGANIPISHLEDTIEAVNPSLTILAAQQIYTAATLLDTAQLLHRKSIPVAFGGQIFNQVPALRKRIPGYFLGENLHDLLQRVKQILSNNSPPYEFTPVSDSYKLALRHYRERQTLIESFIWEMVDPNEMPQVVLAYWNLNTARNITGALTLGSMDYLDGGLHWAKEMLINHNLTDQTLQDYLAIYHLAAQKYLGEAGQPVVEWLAQFNP